MFSTNTIPAAETHRPVVTKPTVPEQSENAQTEQAQFRGFGPMSRVTTAFGQVYAQTLRKGDRVRTKTGEFLAITKIDRMTLDSEYLNYHPGAQPILIRAGAFARGIPTADILMAPHQQLNNQQAFASQGGNKVIDNLHKPHVGRKSETMITYTTFTCERPATVSCEGVWVDIAG